MKDKKLKSAGISFEGLIIFEMSKNHGGDVAHGVKTVREFSKIAKDSGINAAIKLQFQDLDTYIHPHFRGSDDLRMKRYFASRLSEKQFKQIVDEIHAQGLVSMSTPFDEKSVDMLDRLGVQVIKIASSSATDWPLLQRVVESRKPIICSIGGLRIEEVDALHKYFNQHGVPFSFLHCVSVYPTPPERMVLRRIAFLKERYPNVPIGYSTHEYTDKKSSIQMAYALGARVFEKHVIIPDDRLKENLLYDKIRTYTSTPEQIVEWISAYKDAVCMFGPTDSLLYVPDKDEIETLWTMMRGVFAKRPLKKGTKIIRKDVYFAIPLAKGQLTAGAWRDGYIADTDYTADEAICVAGIKRERE